MRGSFTIAGERIRYEDVLHWFAVAGEVAFAAVIVVTIFGVATNMLAPFYGSTLRFLFAVLLVTAPYAELLEIRAHRLRRMSPEERLGFVPYGAPSPP